MVFYGDAQVLFLLHITISTRSEGSVLMETQGEAPLCARRNAIQLRTARSLSESEILVRFTKAVMWLMWFWWICDLGFLGKDESEYEYVGKPPKMTG